MADMSHRLFFTDQSVTVTFIAEACGLSSTGITRTQRRRFRRSSEARGLLSDLCGSLNELGGFGRDGGSGAVNEVQSASLDRLQLDCKETA